MNVRIVVEVDGEKVAEILEDVETLDALALEERVEQIKQRAGRAMLEKGFGAVGESCRRPCCCGRSMRNEGRRAVTVVSRSGEVVFDRARYRCRVCQAYQTPAEAVVCCGKQRVTKLLAKKVCQLATTEHYTRLEQLVVDQHEVHLACEPMWELVQAVGGKLEEQRLVEVAYRAAHPFTEETRPTPAVQPKRVSVSCDGILYGTTETEPDPLHPGQRKQVGKQLRVGAVYWQDAKERWHKQMIWGQEADYQSFGMSLYELAVKHGYLQAEEKIFAADGADRRGRMIRHGSTVSSHGEPSGHAGAGPFATDTSRMPRAFSMGITPANTCGTARSCCPPTPRKPRPGPRPRCHTCGRKVAPACSRNCCRPAARPSLHCLRRSSRW